MTGDDAIRIIREAGLTQAEAARLCGISKTAVQKYRSGGAPSGSTETLLRLIARRPEVIAVLREIAHDTVA